MKLGQVLKFLLVIFLNFFRVHGLGEGIVDINAILGIFNGVANVFSDVSTTDVEVSRLLGKWHQMYKSGVNFDVYQASMYCQVAYFTRNKVMGPQGFTIEESFHVGNKFGPIEAFKRDLEKVGPGEYWMFTEEYFYPRQFYILKTGQQNNFTQQGNDTANSTTTSTTVNITKLVNNERYEYLVATDSNRLALMVYARDPEKYKKLYDKEVQTFLNKQGFGGYVFWNQPVAIYQGSDCYYPSDREIFVRRSLRTGDIGQIQQQQQNAAVLQEGQEVPTGAKLLQEVQQSAPNKGQQSPLSSLSNFPPLSTGSQQSQPLASSSQSQQQPSSSFGNLPVLSNNNQLSQLTSLSNFNNLPVNSNSQQSQQQPQRPNFSNSAPLSNSFLQQGQLPQVPHNFQQINQAPPVIPSNLALQQALFDPEQVQIQFPISPNRVNVQVPLVPYRFPKIQFPSLGSYPPFGSPPQSPILRVEDATSN